ncbi:MAG TPA: hypothetical protein DCP28_12310 [Cytophagales bacterium]|nr:hypothetical protein [Cytophagales bacterium]
MKKVRLRPLSPGRILWVCVLLLCISNLRAQNFSDYNWLFGNHQQHISFLKGSGAFDVLDTTGISLGLQGASVASTGQSGELLLFTDGVTIYDASYQPMRGQAANLNGDTLGNAATVIVPVDGQDSAYYIIYRTAAGDLEYATVSMDSIGNGTESLPLGQVLNINQPLLTGPVGAFTTFQGGDGGPYFLAYQELSGNNDLVTVPITPLNFPPIGSENRTPLPSNPFVAQSIAFTSTGDQLIVSPATANINVHRFQVSTGTGILTFLSTVLNSGFSDGIGANVYDAEISTSGRYLYVSRGGNGSSTGNVFQYDLDSAVTAATVLPNSVARSYGLKRGPDGSIYHLFQETAAGPYLLGRIGDADSVASLVTYEVVDEGIADWGAEQFPEISGTHPQSFTISFVTQNECTGGTTKFFPVVDPPGLSYEWSFDSAGENTSDAVSPIVEFMDPGIYPVTLTVEIPGVGMQSFSQDVEIIDNSMNNVMTVSDTTICPGDTLVIEATGEGITAGTEFWSEIDSVTMQPTAGSELRVTDAGTYWVRVTFDNGCVGSSTTQVTIFDQQEQTANWWDFGNNVQIDFNEDTPVVTSNNIMNAPEGCATISDINGDKLLFSDGNLVYTRTNEIMAPGTPIGGDLTSTQSVAIVPFGSQTDADFYFYVFTTDEVDSGRYEMAMSVVDLREEGALGGVVTADRVIFKNATERLVQANLDGTPTIITHEYGTNSLVGFQITADGLVGPIYLSGGSAHSRSNPDEAEGYLEFNNDATKVAVALKTAAANTVEVFDIDQNTMTLTNELQITLPDAVDVATVYGLEFSNNSSKLFISVNGSPSRIYEVRVDSVDQEFAQESLTQISDDADAGRPFGAIQTTPNNQVVVARDGGGTLGVILVQLDTVASTFDPFGFSLATADGSTVTSTLGLPNFVQSALSQETPPTMNVMDGCLGNVLSFSGSPISQLDTLTWFFGDGNSFVGDTASHQYAQEGTYLVTLELTNRCGLDSVLTDTVIVYQEIPEPTIPNSISLCSDPISLDAADGTNGAPDPSWNYSWSTGETSQAITIADLAGQALLVSVTVSDSIGCTNSDSTLVVDGRPIFDLGTDQTVCQGTAVNDLNASNNGALFTWTLNGVNTGNTTRLQSVNTNMVDTLVYTLTVNDTITGCTDSDTVSFLVNQSPVFTTATTETFECGQSNGSATVTVTSPATFDVVWTGQNGFMGTDAATGNVLDAGIYTVTVTDAVSGCPTTETVSVTDGGDDFAIIDVVPDSSCTLASVQLFLNDSITQGSLVDVFLQNTTTGQLIPVLDQRVTQVVGTGDVGFEVFDLEPGDYFVQVINADDCIRDTTFNVVDLPEVTIASPTFLDACGATTEVTVDVSGLSSPEVLWTAFQGGGFPVTADITQPTVTVDAAGLYLVTVSDESSGLCPATDSVTVNLNSFPGVTINTVGENCEGQLTLELSTAPDGDYSTVWTQNGAQIGIGPSIVVTESGRYDVVATLQTTGCQATDFAAITINDPLEVQAIGDPACDDGNPVTLTAIASGTESDSLLYTWRGPGQISSTLNENTIDVFEPGTYTVTVRRNLTPADGCTALDRIAFERVSFDSVVATELAVVCPPDPDPSINTAVLEASGDFLTFTWTLPDSTDRVRPTLTTSVAGIYRVVAQDAFGCRDTAYSEVRQFCEVFVRAPTAFRPNSPVGNDAYRVIYKNVEEGSFSAQIFNRWGDLIREFNSPTFEWDGSTSNGGLAPQGTYVVVFRYRNQYSDEMEEFVERTRVTLLR